MSKKKILFEAVFFVILTGLTIYYLIASGVFQHMDDLKNVTFLGILFIILCAIGYVLCDAFIIYRNMKCIHNDAKYVDGLGTYMFGNLGSSVTPWKSAHFPMIAYFLNRRGYKLEEIVSTLASNQMIYSITLPFLYSGFMVYALVNQSTVQIGDVNLPLYLVCLFGVLLNIGFFVGLMLLLYNRKFQGFLLKIELWFLVKIKKVKDQEAWKKEKEWKMRIYKKTAERIFHKFSYNIPSIIVYVFFMLLLYGIPYFSYLVLSKATFSIEDYMYCFMLNQAMAYVTNIVPVPGGMIAAEFSFITVFEKFMGSYVNMAVLIYRFSTYILLILLDFIFFTAFEIYLHLRKKGKSIDNNREIEYKEMGDSDGRETSFGEANSE